MLSFVYSSAQQQPPPRELSTGDYLIKAGRQKDAALLVLLVGGAFSGFLTSVIDEEAVPISIGGACFIVSIVCEFSANANLRRAGEKMNGKGLAFSGNGITYRF